MLFTLIHIVCLVQSGAKAKPAQEEDELDEVEELRKSGFLGEGDGSSTLLKVPPSLRFPPS